LCIDSTIIAAREIPFVKEKEALLMSMTLLGRGGAKRKMEGQVLSFAPEELVNEYFHRYDRILERGFSRNPYRDPKVRKRGEPKKASVLSLLERLRTLKDNVMRFFTDFRVSFSNNAPSDPSG
jgi:hypothetical protein